MRTSNFQNNTKRNYKSNRKTIMTYQQQYTLTTPIGNNSFSYNQRKELLGKAEITIPSLIQGTLDDVKIGNHITFEEIDEY